MSFLDRVLECARFDPRSYLPFRVDGDTVGFVKPDTARRLCRYPDIFSVTSNEVGLTLPATDPDSRSRAFDAVVEDLRQAGLVNAWRDEPHAVVGNDGRSVLFTIERAAIPVFGFRGWGVHVNGIVRDGADTRMWVGRRSADKQTAPRQLDQLVAGGRVAGHTIGETVIKEADEEAGIPAEVARRAVPVGTITYCTENVDGLRRDLLYVFDLDLPPSFVPINSDGEIEEFYLWTISKIRNIVEETQQFKFNCALVVIDFLIRNGFISAEHPDYAMLCAGLQSDPTRLAGGVPPQ